ncbi:hypothetical protein PZN02_005367 [Sinorhizobium garamanticum]|uniref:Uncharacterized protein n=1 Tax=Sinorhizobium garamanticum TaxID=680247 RepID=A0ABY8DGK9_9HYPH|nr:hypothetical protein [Sinorhizobium garamanticum]WEX90024.1 hypothetical protein PZN02_005367 [Sinorhizobium garamanticum]
MSKSIAQCRSGGPAVRPVAATIATVFHEEEIEPIHRADHERDDNGRARDDRL